jgi:uncharacterized OB-fold protein
VSEPGGRSPEGVPPQPLPDPETADWWQAAAQGQLTVCRCSTCGVWLHPPLERCRRCGHATRLEPVRGTGTVHSFIVQHRASVPGVGKPPVVICLVDLDDAPGVRLTGRLATDPAAVRVGMPVVARLVPIPGGELCQPEFVPNELPEGSAPLR